MLLGSVLGAKDTAVNKPGVVPAWSCSQPGEAGKHGQCVRHSDGAGAGGLQGPEEEPLTQRVCWSEGW